jgi:hypothetical protein
MVDDVDTVLLAILERLNPPLHRTSSAHYYVDLSRCVVILLDHLIYFSLNHFL